MVRNLLFLLVFFSNVATKTRLSCPKSWENVPTVLRVVSVNIEFTFLWKFDRKNPKSGEKDVCFYFYTNLAAYLCGGCTSEKTTHIQNQKYFLTKMHINFLLDPYLFQICFYFFLLILFFVIFSNQWSCIWTTNK